MTNPTYFCKLCNEVVAEPICPIHNIPAERRDAPMILPKPSPSKAAAREPEAAPPKTPPAESTPRFRAVERGAAAKEDAKNTEAEGAGKAAPSLSQPVSTPSTGRSKMTGEDTLEEAVTAGAEVFLIAGIGGVGKTELIGSFRQAAFRDLFKRKDGMVHSTLKGEINLYAVSYGRRKIRFADTSGEEFRLLDPQFRPTQDITESDLAFLRTVARGLRGLILMIDLERLWDEKLHKEKDANPKQVEVLAWILSLLRWLTRDGRYTAKKTRFSDYIDQTVRRMHQKLRVPVQVIFSRADQLSGFPVPQQQPAWLRQGDVPVRKLSPVGENPLLFAYHCLPELYEAVQTHADYFRFDFAHALATDKGSGAIIDREPCGVHLALQWLFDPAWKVLPRPIASRRWIALDRLIHRQRWERLPDPVGVRS